MEFLLLLLTALLASEWQGAYASSDEAYPAPALGLTSWIEEEVCPHSRRENRFCPAGEASQITITCEAYEEARRANFKLDDITPTAVPSESEWELRTRRMNHSLVITAVEQNADFLRNASQGLQGDWEFVAWAAAQGKARQFCKDGVQLHGAREHALRALQIDGMLLQCASPEFKADKELVSVAVNQSGCALMFANQTFQSDPDFVTQIVAHNGLALLYASTQLQCDVDMWHKALRGSGWDWLVTKVANSSTEDQAHLSVEVPKECPGFPASWDLTVPDRSAMAIFVSSGLGVDCLIALWRVLSNDRTCENPSFSDSPGPFSKSFVPILVCVLVGCFLLILSAVVASKRRTIAQLWSKADHNQCHGVDLEGPIHRPSGASNHGNDEQHLEKTKPS